MQLHAPDHRPEHEIIHEILCHRIEFFSKHSPDLRIIAKWKSDLADWEAKFPELKNKQYSINSVKGN